MVPLFLLPLFALILGSASLSAQPTYSKEVSRIVQAKCQICHRPNDIAPFALLTYDDAVTFSADIERVLKARIMPPWKPVSGVNEFRDSYGLTDDERQTVLDWISAGTPQGNPADLPEKVPAPDGPWALGAPDLALKAPPFTPPRARDSYRCFVIPSGLDADTYVNATQVLPGNRQLVHHVLLYMDTSGYARKRDYEDGQPGYSCFGGPGLPTSGLVNLLGAWAPGSRPRKLDEGIGILIPAKADVVMQVHYNISGPITEDQTQVGIYFAPADTTTRRLISVPIANQKFTIPAGASDYMVSGTERVPPLPILKGQAISVGPHMHLLGKSIRVELDRAGEKTPMIQIDNWDFNWQGAYFFTKPMDVQGGDVFRVTSVFDNSDKNPKNPNNPLKDVSWGEGTADEMCLAYIGLAFDRELLSRLIALLL